MKIIAKKKVFGFLFLMAFCCMMISPVQVQAKALNKTTYSKVKGWWTDVSSGGYDRKFTRTSMKIYRHKGKKVLHTCKYYGYKKVKRGYMIKFKCNKHKFCYIYNKKYKTLDYYGNWTGNVKDYSGSSSLMKGRWK